MRHEWPQLDRRSPILAVFAATGALAFIVALAWTMWFYIVQLGRPAPFESCGVTFRAALINIVLFVAFATHHSVMARGWAKAWLTRIAPPAFERPMYVWASSVLLVLLCIAWQPIPGVLYELRGWKAAVAHAVQLAGVALTLVSAHVLSLSELAGVSGAGGEGSSETRHSISSRGPYALVRHPIYLGWILMVFPTPRLTGGRLLFAAMTSAYLFLAVPWEERELVATHGDEYRRYQRAVRWRILPGLF
jgi:protein-S-isoprenylcysteine O-methyltransferase Ste14